LETNPNVKVIGIEEDYLKTSNYEIDAGRNFTPNDIRMNLPLAIIGYDIRNDLFKGSDVPGRSIGEIISLHYEIKVEKDTVAFIYQTMACHSYNVININNQAIKIATIDTMLSFYLAFLYSNKDYYDINRILCMSQYLFKVQQHNRLNQKGLLKRFSIECYGHQETLEEMRANKNKLFLSLKNKKNTKEYELHFMRYRPDNKIINAHQEKKLSEKKLSKKKYQKKNITKKKRGRGGLFI
jgi:hypothetical protein